MHATVQELITLRDGELVSADVVQHVAACRECHAEFTRLLSLRERLRELPGFQPPAFDAAALAERGERIAWARRRLAVSRIAVPLVAASLGVVAFVTLTQSVFRNPATSPAGAAAAAVTSAQQQPDPAREPSAAVRQLMARSQRLEAALQELPQRPAVEHVATSSAIDALQARIQLLDAQLAATPAGGLNPEQSYALWNDRVQLLNSLVGVRYAEATRDSYPTTSRGVI